MSDQILKTQPRPTPETEPYWQGCKEHKLLIQSCSDCGHVQFYPRCVCTKCVSKNLDWIEASGQATVISYTVMHRSVSKAYCVDGPQVLALVRLEEGPQMMSHVIDCNEDDLSMGMAVDVTFEDWGDEVSMPVFRPKEGES